MTAPLPPAAQHVQDLLRSLGFANIVREMPGSTRTSAEAAAAVGCGVAQIAKSIVFRLKPGPGAVLVVASGTNRVDERKIATLLGEALGKADAEFVRGATGYVIGGVAPIGHASKLRIVIDRDLLNFENIWAAAGTPYCVFEMTPDELVRMTGGTVADVALKA
ncbi:MAG: YbaK/EbsC family protein [Alphaproteobacteria bacterium]